MLWRCGAGIVGFRIWLNANYDVRAIQVRKALSSSIFICKRVCSGTEVHLVWFPWVPSGILMDRAEGGPMAGRTEGEGVQGSFGGRGNYSAAYLFPSLLPACCTRVLLPLLHTHTNECDGRYTYPGGLGGEREKGWRSGMFCRIRHGLGTERSLFSLFMQIRIVRKVLESSR